MKYLVFILFGSFLLIACGSNKTCGCRHYSIVKVDKNTTKYSETYKVLNKITFDKLTF